MEKRRHIHKKTLTVSGILDSLDDIAKYVMAAAAEAGLGKKVGYRLRLAVDEVATNIITHGYDEADLEGNIDVWADIDEKALTIYLEDTGVPYDPQLDKTPGGLDLPMEERQIGGLGLYLAARNVDQFSYERSGDRNRHIFVVNRNSPSSEVRKESRE